MSSAAQPVAAGGATWPARAWLVSLRAGLPPVLAAAAWHALLLAGYVLAFGGDLSALVCADRERVGRWPYETVRVGFGTPGFDGQFYYTLARDPWRLYGAPIDVPAYRHARILYPALAWALSGGGDPGKLLWAMPAINLLAAAGLAWLGARLALHHGRSAWWGFLLPVVVNVGMPALRNLTDPLAALTACGLLTAWLLRSRAWVVFAWAAAAVLSREQNAAVVLIVLLAALYHRQWRHAAGLAAAVLLLAGWLAALRGAYGEWPFSKDNVSLPLAGMFDCWRQPGAFPTVRSAALHAVGMLLIAAQVALSVGLAFVRVNRSVKLVALAGALLALVAGAAVYEGEWSYTRVFLWMPLAVWLGSVVTGRRWPLAVLSPAALWPCLAVAQVWLK